MYAITIAADLLIPKFEKTKQGLFLSFIFVSFKNK